MDLEDIIRERLTAYIHPNVAETKAQLEAFENAVEAQLEYEQAFASESIPGNVQAFTSGKYSVTLREGQGTGYTQSTICPAARAILFNAGLLKRSLPVARRL